MENVPTEIHDCILALACTDDGTTGRALGLVSRYIRAVALPYVYQSLAVAGHPSLQGLLDRLEATPPHLRRVRHLFLSDWTQDQVLRFAVDGRLSDDWASAQKGDLGSRTIQRILTLVSPTLHTLSFLAHNPTTSTALLARLFETPFPALTALTVHGFYPFPAPAPAAPPRMARLEKLHLGGHRNPHGLLQTGALAAACPRLTHLRVSGLASALSFARELDAALRTDRPGHGPASAPAVHCPYLFRPRLPPALTHVCVEPGPPPPSRCRRRAAHCTVDQRMMDVLRRLGEDASRGSVAAQKGSASVRYALLDRMKDGGASAFVGLRAEWEGEWWVREAGDV